MHPARRGCVSLPMSRPRCGGWPRWWRAERRADELFAAVPQEAGQLLQADQMTTIRYGSDGTSTVVANWRRTGEPVPPVGALQLPLRLR